MDYRKLYNREEYIFDDINNRFRDDKFLSAEDFFFIVIWKSNRAKSTISNLITNGNHDGAILKDKVKELTSAIYLASSSKDKMNILYDWGFSLPMASAILTALYPQDFTVYDMRICKMLDAFKNLANKRLFDDLLWAGYQQYVLRVASSVEENMSLRDKDRYLWGKSFYEELRVDIANGMPKKAKKRAKA